MKWDKIHGKYFSQCLAYKCSKYMIAIIIQVFWGSPDFKYFVPFSDCFPFEIPKCDHCAFLFSLLRRLCFFRLQDIKLPPLPTLNLKPSVLVRDILLTPQAVLCPWRIGRVRWDGGRSMILNPEVLSQKSFQFSTEVHTMSGQLEARVGESFHQFCLNVLL